MAVIHQRAGTKKIMGEGLRETVMGKMYEVDDFFDVKTIDFLNNKK